MTDTGKLLRHQAKRYEQLVFLGSGFDCRALWLDGLREGCARVYEAETRFSSRRDALSVVWDVRHAQ